MSSSKDSAAAAAEDESDVVDTTKADRSVWLMKCPPLVTRSCQSAAASASTADLSIPGAANPVMGKVVVSLDPLLPDEPNPVKFKMELAQHDSGHAPKCYSLNMFKDFVPLCTFSESNQDLEINPIWRRRYAVEGKVEHKFDMEPHAQNFIEYGRLCRERTKKANEKSRQLQLIDNDRGTHMRPLPGMVGLISAGSKDKKKPTPTKGTDAKRTRRDRRELENIIFKLFERQPNWSLKQLVQETDQPEQFMKEILNDLCVYNKRGPNQGTHELKPEYKKSSEEIDNA